MLKKSLKLSFILSLSLWTLGFGHCDFSVKAADYTPDQLNLNFFYEDQSSLRDFTSEFNQSQPESLQADQYLLIGPSVQSSEKGVYEIYIGQQDLYDILAQYQLRIINTQQITNVDLLGTTAIELVGDSFTNFDPLRLVLFSYEGQSVAILYRGASASVFQEFLINISEPSPFAHEGPRHLFQKEIDDVVERGIFSGYISPDGKKEFRADQGINRAEFLKVIVLAAPGVTDEIVQSFYKNYKTQILEDDRIAAEDDDESTKALFYDVDREAWFAAYIFFAFDKGWVGGYPDGSFRPIDPINMAEAPKIILAARNTFLAPDLETWFKPYLDYFNSKNVLVQRADQYRFSFTDSMFYPYEPVSRGQTAALLSRLLWVDDQSDTDRFAQVIDAGALPFSFEDSGLKTFKLDRSLEKEASELSYLVYRNGKLVSELLEFSPQSWTERTRKERGVGELASLHYLGETKAAVFASLVKCSSSVNCASEDIKTDFEKSFRLRQEDLLLYEDINVGIRFNHLMPIDVQAQIEGDVRALQVTRDGKELVILNLLNNTSEDVKFFEGDQADSRLRIGNRDWYIYQVKVGEESQLRLVTSMGVRKVLVAVIRNITSFQELDAKVIRMLRTVERF
jgi:hypothetical protein